MGFTLSQKNTGASATFNTHDLLKILGDPLNDEIVLHGITYRLSTFSEIGIEGYSAPNVLFRTVECPVLEADKSVFAIPQFNGSVDSLLVTVNGVVRRYGEDKDFHYDEGDLYWHGDDDLIIGDMLIVRWLDYDF